MVVSCGGGGGGRAGAGAGGAGGGGGAGAGAGELSGTFGSLPTKLPLIILYTLQSYIIVIIIVHASILELSFHRVKTRKIAACFLKPSLQRLPISRKIHGCLNVGFPNIPRLDASVALPATTALGAMASPACACAMLLLLLHIATSTISGPLQ